MPCQKSYTEALGFCGLTASAQVQSLIGVPRSQQAKKKKKKKQEKKGMYYMIPAISHFGKCSMLTIVNNTTLYSWSC